MKEKIEFDESWIKGINENNGNNDIKIEDNKNQGLKKIKIYVLKNTKKLNNNAFEKEEGKNGECRYFNIFGYEEAEISLTQMEKDYSGMIDSSTSNEIQMNPDYFFRETPKNVFKVEKSNDQSVNSNNNEV